MGPFYVQIEHVPTYWNGSWSVDNTIIMFKDMDIADEWWRTISIDNKYVDLERAGPCYYVHVHDSSKGSQSDCATYNIGPSNNLGRVKWPHVLYSHKGGYQQTAPPVIPPQDVTDRISGNTFLIRSKADPRDFWHIPRRGVGVGILLVSRTDRTRFRVAAKDAPAPLNGGPIVMIGSDAIEITEARTGRVIGIDSSGHLALGASSSGRAMTQLVVEERTETSEQLVVEERGGDAEPVAEVTPEGNQENDAQIYFKDLKTTFSVVPEDYSAVFSGPLPTTRRLEIGDGEEWELV